MDALALVQRIQRFQPLIVVLLLLAACGLGGQFVADAFCGAYGTIGDECHERQPVDAGLTADCSCSHSGYVLPASALSAQSFAFTFNFALADGKPASASIRPPSPPPILIASVL